MIQVYKVVLRRASAGHSPGAPRMWPVPCRQAMNVMSAFHHHLIRSSLQGCRMYTTIVLASCARGLEIWPVPCRQAGNCFLQVLLLQLFQPVGCCWLCWCWLCCRQSSRLFLPLFVLVVSSMIALCRIARGCFLSFVLSHMIFIDCHVSAQWLGARARRSPVPNHGGGVHDV